MTYCHEYVPKNEIKLIKTNFKYEYVEIIMFKVALQPCISYTRRFEANFNANI